MCNAFYDYLSYYTESPKKYIYSIMWKTQTKNRSAVCNQLLMFLQEVSRLKFVKEPNACDAKMVKWIKNAKCKHIVWPHANQGDHQVPVRWPQHEDVEGESVQEGIR